MSDKPKQKDLMTEEDLERIKDNDDKDFVKRAKDAVEKRKENK